MPIKQMGMPESEMEPGEMAEEGGEEAVATLDLSIIGDQEVTPGDRIELEVVSVDPEIGSLKVRYPKPEEESEGGIEEMAAAFDQKPSTEEY